MLNLWHHEIWDATRGTIIKDSVSTKCILKIHRDTVPSEKTMDMDE